MHSGIKKYLLILMSMVCLFSLSACGGGGGGESPASNTPGVTVSGKVAVNIVYPGTVRVYGINSDGTLKLPALTEGPTASDGSFSLSIGGYQGAIVARAFGRFTDEATKTVIDIPEDKSLSAALSDVEAMGKNSITLYISPLSDLAYRKAGAASDFPGNIAAANQAVTQLFGVDITKTPPVPFDADTYANSATTADQIRLGILLAVLSQYTANGSSSPAAPTASDLQNALAGLASGITLSGGTMQLSPAAANQIQQAVSSLKANGNTTPVVAAGGGSTQAMLSTLETIGSSGGKKLASFRLRTTGTYSSGLYGISVTVGVPAGFLLRTDETGLTQSGVVIATGQAGVNSHASGNVAGSKLTVGLGSTDINGFGIGEFVTVYGEISADASTPPAAGAFAPVTIIKISDKDGNSIPGVGIEVF